MDGRGMAKVGTIGDLTCFSFYATKNITSAEGGMITTEDDALAEKIAVASLHGMDRDAWKRYDTSGSWFYEIHDMGFKYNLSDVHAAIGLAQFKRADDFMRRRQTNRARLQRGLSRRCRARRLRVLRTRHRARVASLCAAHPARARSKSGAITSSRFCASAASDAPCTASR